MSQDEALLRHSTVPAGELGFFYTCGPEHGTVVTIAKTTACPTTGGFHVLQLLRRIREFIPPRRKWNVVFAMKSEL